MTELVEWGAQLRGGGLIPEGRACQYRRGGVLSRGGEGDDHIGERSHTGREGLLTPCVNTKGGRPDPSVEHVFTYPSGATIGIQI